LQSEQFDIETAFLYGDMDEELWMVFPEGYSKFLEESGKNFQVRSTALKLKRFSMV
jgi:hypothetical protein